MTQRSVGRPKIGPATFFRCTGKLRAELEALARAEKVKLSELIRRLLEQAVLVERRIAERP